MNNGGITSAGTTMFQLTVMPSRCDSTPGISRTAPSSQAMYQSGCEPAVTSAGLYGPYSQTGLICSSAPITASTPKTTKKNPPALAAYTGSRGNPTTFFSVLPGPGNCVCL